MEKAELCGKKLILLILEYNNIYFLLHNILLQNYVISKLITFVLAYEYFCVCHLA